MKTIANYDRGDILEIDWEDIYSKNGWYSAASIKKHDPCRCKSVGFFVGKTKSSITISIAYELGHNDVLNPQVIPVGAIRRIRRICKKTKVSK